MYPVTQARKASPIVAIIVGPTPISEASFGKLRTPSASVSANKSAAKLALDELH